MNEIIERWNALVDGDREHELFDAYVYARKNLLSEIRQRVNGQGTNVAIKSLFGAERDAFSQYMKHRLETKPQ